VRIIATPVLCSLALLAGHAAAAEVKVIDLRFTPSESEKDVAPSVPADMLDVGVRILDATDARPSLPDPGTVGRFLNKDVEVRSDDPVPPFVTDVLHRLAERWHLTPDPRATRVLETEVRLFEVEVDKGAFNANVHLVFRVRDTGLDTVTYQAVHAGHDGSIGFRSREANYNRVLSNALREAVAKLLSDPAFQDAVLGRAESIVQSVIAPEGLLNELLRMKRAGMSEATLIEFVRTRTIQGPFTADHATAWAEAGIPESVLREAMARAR
jgi:hypothetical protein